MLSNRKIGVLQLFKSLKGVWKLCRRWGTHGHMQGIACFQTWGQEEALYYQERGSATFGNSKRRLSAYQAYTYVYEKSTISVYFGNQGQEQLTGLLHTLQFHSTKNPTQSIVATGTHTCANDTYCACYTFVDQRHFQLTYQVQGPCKDYVIQTYFSKVV